ncbi:TPA: MGMT family protein [Vibrio harveyi]|uniref:MGMT family protein n=1 Tax=Vibrio harveyi TaxID=669 RepID=UPI00237F4AD5|nr:MGMT family protein [Vibrio harveyi]HDM8070308.1 MGMT family protein [Vibrio harveyi]
MTKTNWQEILHLLQQSVPEGTITTYGDLSLKFYGHKVGGQAIGTMLGTAVERDSRNVRFTNRVIRNDGQLIKEGIPLKDGRVDLSKANREELGGCV